MTLHQMLKISAAFHLTYLNTTVQFAPLLPPNVSPSVNDLQPDDVFQGFYGVKFVTVRHLLQVAQKK
jgi:hypothetical protein